MKEIPRIDISSYLEGRPSGKKEVAKAVDNACREIGFLIVTGYDVPSVLIERMRTVSLEFFKLPLEVKMKYKMPPDRYRGYTAIGTQALVYSYGGESPPDLRESFSIGPVGVPDNKYHRGPTARSFFAQNIWPAKVNGFKETWTEYYRTMEALATKMMRIFALALDLPEHFFDDKIDMHITNFAVNFYPRLLQEPLRGQLRTGVHSDYGSLSILQQDDAPGGLEVLSKDGDWIDVPFVPDSFVINLGELMAEWTNDRWVSTVHRVVNPPLGSERDRMSMVFFHQPNYDAVIEVLPTCCGPNNPPKYKRTTSGEHIFMQLRKARTPELGKQEQAP